jgi:lipoate---protein ligase
MFMLKPTLHIVRMAGIPIYEQLQLEEALLRADDRNWCLVNEGSPEAIVMGISGKPEELINFSKLREEPIPMIRRFSGGGTVVIDHDTTFVTFICNKDCVKVPGIPEKILQWTASVYEPVFAQGGFRVRENDYVLGEKKFGGNAQYICKQRWLHHSSLLWDFQEANMDYLLMPKKMPTYRQQRKHQDFLCRLRDYLPDRREFLSHLNTSLKTRFILQEVDWKMAWSLTARPHRKGSMLLMTDERS